MPFAAAENGPHADSGDASGNTDESTSVPNRQLVQLDAAARLRRFQRLLARAPLAHGVLTVVICSYVVQHPAVVLVLMLGFPALLMAQEAVDRRLLAQAEMPWVELPSRQQGTSLAIDAAADAPRHSLPRGMPIVADGAPANTSTPAAA